jgi:hypothetical protein
MAVSPEEARRELARRELERRKAQPSTAADVAKAAGSGLVEGGFSLAGLPGDIDTIAHAAGTWLGNKAREIGGKGPAAPTERALPLPTSQEAMDAVGFEPYQPKTTAGEYARTAASFVPASLAGPGSLATKVIGYGVVPGLASEAAGQATEGTRFEPYARAAGALAGFAAPSVARKLVTPLPSTPERQTMVNALKKEGVDTTAGQNTGNMKLRYFESEVGGAKAADVFEKQGEQFTKAALKRAGINADRATPQVIDDAFDRIGGEIDRLSASNAMRFDRKLNQDLVDILDDYNSVAAPAFRRPIVDSVAQDLASAVAAAQKVGGTALLEGKTYQKMRSRLGKTAQQLRTSDPEAAETLRNIQHALDDAMERSLTNPADMGAWREARRQYRNLLVLEKAATGAGENVAMGLISPSQLRAATVQQGRRAYARGQGDYAELARSGEAVLKPLPNSGTSPRTDARNMLAVPQAIVGGSLGYGATGDWEGAVAGAALGGLSRAAMSRAVMGPRGQRYLSNQALVALPAADPRKKALVRALGTTMPLRSE